MKLIRLELLNLASLDKPDGEVIDFTEGALGQSNIFSIVGPTGSGKSTLLDAICLALYGRTPRYPKFGKLNVVNIKVYEDRNDGKLINNLSTTDCRNILTHGKKECYSKLTFLANDGRTYRAEWHARVKSTNFNNDIKPSLYRLCESPDRTRLEETCDWNSLPQIIGLDYEQFLRTVLIAQGSFSNFLKATEDDRFKLLEKLIGSETLYTTIVDQIKARTSQALEAYNAINSSIATIKQDLLTDDELRQLEEQIERLDEAEQKLASDLKTVEQQLQWYADDRSLLEDITGKQEHADRALDRLKAFDPDARRLALHDALDEAIDLLRACRRQTDELGRLQSDIDTSRGQAKLKTEAIERENNRLEQLSQAAMAARQALDDATPHLLRGRELITQIEEAKKSLIAKAKAKQEADKKHKDAHKAVLDNKAAITTSEQALARLESHRQNIDTRRQREHESLSESVATVKGQLKAEQDKIEGVKADELQQQKSVADLALNDLTRAIDIVSRHDQAVAERQSSTNRRAELERGIASARTELGQLAVDQLTQEVSTLDKNYTLMTSEQWELHRHSLSAGSPCPLCGAMTHPYHQDNDLYEEATSQLRNLLEAKRAELKRQQNVERQLTGIITRSEGELKGIMAHQQQLTADIDRLEGEWQQLSQRHPGWPKDKAGLAALQADLKCNQSSADKALKYYNHTQQRIAELTAKKEAEEKKLTEFDATTAQKLADVDREIADCKTQLAVCSQLEPTLAGRVREQRQVLASATSDWQTVQQQLSGLNAELKRELGDEMPDTMERRLKKTASDADATLADQHEALTRQRNELSQLNGAIDEKAKSLTEKQLSLNGDRKRLAQWMAAYNARADRLCNIGLADVAALLNANDNWEALRQLKENLSNQVSSSRALLDEAHKKHALHQDSKPEQTQELLTARRAELQQSSQRDQLLNAQATKKSHDNAKLKLGSKSDELERAQQERNDWVEISEAIGSDGKTLRKIAQCYTLGFLIDHANEEIRKFNNRYELRQVKNSLGIIVIDHDRADDIRYTTSLSGGETFIVSLGLALGLSSLSSRNIRFDNLFIDEGFGTLDADTLATVIDSLAMLQTSQGKKVGVISHTDTMSERITTQIRVIPNGSTGSSRIEIVP